MIVSVAQVFKERLIVALTGVLCQGILRRKGECQYFGQCSTWNIFI